MSHDPQHEIWNPCGEQVDSLSASERVDMEKSRAWALYGNGGGGDPSYFDYQAWQRGRERSRG
jgi:hypothetical protein